MKAGFRYDVVVIGAGTAGLVAGIRLAQSGASVAVLAKGVGSTHLAPATLDIAGYTPKPVAVPLKGVAALTANDAGHPYELIGTDTLRESVEWFADTVAAGPLAPYAYAGSLKRNMLLPTAVGALRPSALVPTTMVAGDASATSVSETGRKSSRSATFSTCIVGTPSLRDFHPSLCAANLTAAGFPARPVMLELELERADMSTLGIARHLDDARWRAGFCGRLARLLRSDEQTVGLPAMLGIADPDGVMTDIEKRLGRRVFEIPSLPPSVPGMRLYETLRAALLGAGGRLMLGAEVIAHERSGDRIRSVSTRAAGHDVSYAADWFVLAAGGFASGAASLDSHWRTHEHVLDLPLRGGPAEGEPRFVAEYFAEQPLERVGIAVGKGLRAESVDNVLVAGAALPGAVPWREGSGEGLALSSGYKAAQVITSTAGTTTAAGWPTAERSTATADRAATTEAGAAEEATR